MTDMPPSAAPRPSFVMTKQLLSWLRLLVQCIFFFFGLLIIGILYAKSVQQIRTLGLDVHVVAPLLVTIQSLAVFAVALLIIIIAPAILMRLHLYRPIEIEEQILREKTSFLRMAEDAIRTPIASMRWIVSELNLASQKGKRISKAHVKEMSDAISRLLVQMNELLSISQLSGGYIRYNPIHIGINGVIVSAIEAMKPLIKSKKQIVKYVPVNDATQIFVDPPLISHALQILIGNISQLSPDKCTLAVAVTELPDTVSIRIAKAAAIQDISLLPPVASDVTTFTRCPFSMTMTYEIVKAGGGTIGLSDDATMPHCVVELPRKILPKNTKNMFDI